MKKPLSVNLQAEIEFWQSLINNWDPSQNEPVHARMQEALALAEYKLQQQNIANVAIGKVTLH